MKDINKLFIVMLIASILSVSVSGCIKKGPAEKAGEKIDKTVEKAGEKIDHVLK